MGVLVERERAEARRAAASKERAVVAEWRRKASVLRDLAEQVQHVFR